MRLVASVVPSPPPPDFTGRVHSVFSRVVNLSDREDGLLTLYAGAASALPPGAILLSAPADFDFSAHVSPGAATACRGGVLRIARSSLSVDLRSARTAPETASDWRAICTDFAPAWRIVWRILADAAPRSGFAAVFADTPPARALDTALAARLRCALPPLLAALPGGDANAAAAAAAPLIGAGYGLTPSGDDFLAGFVYAAQRSADTAAQRAQIDDLVRRLAEMAASGDISRSYFVHAGAGRVAPSLACLATAILAQAGRNALASATADALAIGHSSGADAALGLLCGLAAWRKDLAASVLVALRASGQPQAERRP